MSGCAVGVAVAVSDVGVGGVPQDSPGETTWRYAIVKAKLPNGDAYCSLREVYTGPNGELSWTTEPVAAEGENSLECAADLALMTRAINGTFLDTTVDPPEWKVLSSHD